MEKITGCFFILWLLTTHAFAQTRADKLVEKGNSYFESYQFTRALKFYEKATRADPESRVAHYRVALTNYRMDSLDQAVNKLQYLLEYFPPNVEISILMGHLQFRRENWISALNFYLETTRMDDQYALAYEYSGRCYLELGEWQQALQKFERSLLLEPNSPDAIFNLGRCYDKLGSEERAKGYYQMALDFKTYQSQGHYNLANVYLGRKEYSSALRYINQYLKDSPESVEGIFTKGAILLEMGSKAEGCQWIRKALEGGHKDAASKIDACKRSSME